MRQSKIIIIVNSNILCSLLHDINKIGLVLNIIGHLLTFNIII